jgi:tol-pal system protein YbgF
MRLRLRLFAFLIVPFAAFGANKEMVELQRDVATLQDQVRTLQTSQTEKLTSISVLLQQTLDAANNAVKAMAVLESRVNDRLDKQTASVGQPVVAVGAKVDQMSSEFQSLRESMNDVGSRIGKLELKLVDLNNAIRTIQAPPPAPTAAANSAPVIPAGTLYETAYRDKMTGKPELALKGFTEYVQLYRDTNLAPDAQFFIGQIHAEQGDFDSAVKDFDAVVENWPSNGKTADALYAKGMALVKLNKKTDGAKEFRAVLTKYPTHEAAPKACSQLKALGLSCGVPAATKKKARN